MPRFLLIPILLACAVQSTAPNGAPEDRTKVIRNIVIESGEAVNDVECFACSVRVRGQVNGDIVTIGGNISVEGIVDGDAVAVGGHIDMRSRARISGDAVAIGGYVKRSGESAIEGDEVSIPYILIPGQNRPTILGCLALAVVNLLFVAAAYGVLRSRRVDNISQVIRHRTAIVLVVGIITLPVMFGLVLLCGFLGRAEDGAVLALGGLFVVVAALGAPGLGSSAAKIAFPKTKGAGTAFAGILALTFLEIVPLLGFVVFLVGLLLSLGGAIVSRFGSRAVPSPVPFG